MSRRTREPHPRTLTVAQAAYIAGIIDGEGHIGVRRQKVGSRTYLNPILQIGQAKPDVLDWLVDVLGYEGMIAEHRQRDGWMNLRIWSTMIRWLLPQVMPYLVLKRRQAELVLHLSEITRAHGLTLSVEQWSERERIAAEVHELNETPAAKRRRVAAEGTA